MDDDIDDYFNDDLVLDEQAIAILDREEKKYYSQIQPPPPPPPPLPVAPLPAVTKKRKTRNGWAPGIGSQPREQDSDDLPEISVTIDGNYGFTDSALTSGLSDISKTLSGQPSQSNATLTSHTLPHLPRVSPPPQPALYRKNPVPNTLRQQNSAVASPIPCLAGNSTNNEPEFEKQIAELQMQLFQLRNQNQKIQGALKEATDIRYAKEGEVSILRKNIEKIVQSHAAEIAKMKTAREEADLRQKQMERQMKEETERLRTQFMFKQHELETASRRPPSARASRVMKNAPATPMRVPSQISTWNAPQNIEQTPLRPGPHTPYTGPKPPEFIKGPAFLPGFQNSFATTPLKLGMRVDHRGKAKDFSRAESLEVFGQVASQKTEPFHQQSIDDLDLGGNIEVVPNSDDPIPHADEDGDTAMLDDAVEEGTEEAESTKPPNPRAELSRIILTHAHRKFNEITFQVLIGLSFVTNLPDAQAMECTHAAQAILFTLSQPAETSNYELCCQKIAKYLIVMFRCMRLPKCSLPMAALLDLLRTMVLSLPAFKTVVLLHKPEGEEENSLLLITIFDLLESLSVSPQYLTDAPIEEIVSLLELLLFDIPDVNIHQLTLIPRRVTPLLALLNVSQPREFLESLSRVFLLLATYSSVHEQLSISPDQYRGEDIDRRDSPLVHQLCIFLLESFNANFTQTSVTHSNLLGCLAQLSLTQADRLVDSPLVIPTLVYLIAQWSVLLWNDDETNLTREEANSIIRAINQGLFLLHHLVHSSETTTRFHEKLLHSPHRNLSNVEHQFVVSFGQLSYADPPDWITAEGKVELEYLAHTTRDLLDLVVDGPEADSVWAAYQLDRDNESETDDEEREARLRDDNMQL